MQVSYLCGPGCIPQFRHPALVLAHPGHELKIFGWMCDYMPRVYILTDGSGSRLSRLASTEKLLARARASCGEIFGQLSDRDVYEAIMQKKVQVFLKVLNWLANSLGENEIDFVVGDATEGFNPAHDICRALLNAAVFMTECDTGKNIANYEFCLTEWELHCKEIHDERCLHLLLDDELLRGKLDAAMNYGALRHEVEQAIQAKGQEYFRIECMKKVVEPFPHLDREEKPYYETFGEQRVREGKYSSVIRYREHVMPLLEAIRKHALEKMSTNTLVSTAAAGRA